MELGAEGARKWSGRRRQHPVCGSVLRGRALSLGAEVFVCRAQRYRFPLHVSAFFFSGSERGGQWQTNPLLNQD